MTKSSGPEFYIKIYFLVRSKTREDVALRSYEGPEQDLQ
jgi:hypothetical protein